MSQPSPELRKLSTLTIAAARPALRLAPVRLVVDEGPDRGLVHDDQRERIGIGSVPGNDLVLTDPAVSRHHLEILAVEEGHLVRDLGSTNGTFVEGVRVREAFLHDGARLRVGETQLRFELDRSREAVVPPEQPSFGGLIGASPAMRRVFARLAKVAGRDATVLVTGESGTGKELVARALHEQSPTRRNGPFEVVDCGAMPLGLMESHIFGHQRGAFTGAVEARPGAFERAHGGTLFLDEIGELPLELQPKLLRVIETREVMRLGGPSPRKVDVRLVAATNRDLRQEVNRLTFRSDLFYRLSVVEVRLPPLRERIEDVPLLVEHFLERLSRAELAEGARYQLAAGAVEYLVRHQWPGNVRELRNFIERAVSLSEGTVICDDPEELADALPPGPPAPGPAPGPATPASGRDEADPAGPLWADLHGLPFHAAKRLCNEQFEREYLKALLERNGGVVARSAREAGMDRTHLNELLRKHQLK